MKKFFVIASAILLISSCKDSDLERSNQERDSLVSVIKERENNLNEREKSLNEFVNSFNEVERNLDSVAVRQKFIYSTAEKFSGDIKGNQKERINAHIEEINKLMSQNRKTIGSLQRKLKNSNRKNSQLEETIASLTERLAQKDAELAELNEKLTSLNAQLAQLQSNFDTLTQKSMAQALNIEEQKAALYTAYYIVGKPKDLREANVVDKKGGLLGIGKSTGLSKDFDQAKFTRIDYTQTSSIPVNSDKVKIITNHPSDSYRLETIGDDKDKVRNLVITDPVKFWSVSKYLVIQGNPVETDEAVTAKTELKKSDY